MKATLLFSNSVRETFRLIMRDKAMVMMLVIAPIIYGFYYPWPYSTQMVRNTTIGIVDQNGDSLSRKMTRLISAHSHLDVTHYLNTRDAKTAMLSHDIAAYIIIPKKMTQNVASQQATKIPVVVDGAYLLLGKSGISGVLQAIGTLSGQIEVSQLVAQGVTLDIAKTIINPTPLMIENIYNPNEGYGNYIVPAVVWLILQQSLLIAAALFIGTLSEKKHEFTTFSGWLGRVCALSSLNMLMSIFYTGFVFIYQDYGHGGNPLGNLLLIAIFSPTVATIGCILGLLFKVRERALQVITFSSMPLFFFSGYSWPLESLPEALQWARWLIPSSSAIQAGVGFNQMGVSISDNAHYLVGLLMLLVCSLLLLSYLGRSRQ